MADASVIRSSISSMIKTAVTTPNCELEVVMARTDRLKRLDSMHLRAMLEHNKFESVHNDLTLDIITASGADIEKPYRVTIKGRDNIGNFCGGVAKLKSFNLDVLDIITKTAAEDTLLLPLYDARVNLKREEDIKHDMQAVAAVLNRADSSRYPKTYRLKNRVSYSHPDHPWRVDITEVKTSALNAVSFTNCGIDKAPIVRELEVEFIGDSKVDGENAYNSLILLCRNITRAIRRSPVILSPHDILSTVNGYLKLLNGNAINLVKLKSDFTSDMYLSKKPKTLTRSNVCDPTESGQHVNIFRDGPYAVTFKADGENCLLYIDSKGNINLIYDTRNVARLPGTSTSINTLCSAELIEPNLKQSLYQVLIYEIYIDRGVEVWQKPLTDRLMFYSNVVKSISGCDTHAISAKRHFFPEPLDDSSKLYTAVTALKETEDSLTYETDGLIFTKINDSYGEGPLVKQAGVSNKSLTVNIYKWKPSYLNSVDARIKFDEDYLTSKDTFGCTFTVGYSSLNNPAEDVLSSIYMNIKQNTHYAERILGRGKIERIKENYYVITTQDGWYLSRDDNRRSMLPLYDDSIVECRFDQIRNATGDVNYMITPFRNRDDKTEILRTTGLSSAVNDLTVSVLPILDSVKSPIEISDMTSPTRTIWSADTDEYYQGLQSSTKVSAYRQLTLHREYCNSVKNIMFKTIYELAGSESKLLDIGSGTGGDLHKYINVGLNTVLGVDRSFSNVYTVKDCAYDRFLALKKRPMRPVDYIFLALDATLDWKNSMQMHRDPSLYAKISGIKTPNDEFNNKMLDTMIDGDALPDSWPDALHGWRNMLNKNQFKCVTCMFAFHYFLTSATTLNTVVKNIANNIAEGGIFTAVLLDGDLVEKALSATSDGILKDDGRSLHKVGKWKLSAKPEDNYGKMLRVYIASISKYAQDEPIADIRLIDNVFKEYGMERITDVAELDCTILTGYINTLGTIKTTNVLQFNQMTKPTREYLDLHRIISYRKV